MPKSIKIVGIVCLVVMVVGIALIVLSGKMFVMWPNIVTVVCGGACTRNPRVHRLRMHQGIRKYLHQRIEPIKRVIPVPGEGAEPSPACMNECRGASAGTAGRGRSSPPDRGRA